jgi:peptidyl-prolyl cis-trans isomerase A (cyclophilin A)
MLAMANAGIQGGRGPNGSQFFITVGPTTWLQGKHTIFGEVADDESRRVVDKLAGLPTDARDRPLDDVVIESITVEQA